MNLIPCSSYLKATLTWYNSYQEQWLQIPLQSYSVEKFANYLYRENGNMILVEFGTSLCWKEGRRLVGDFFCLSIEFDFIW